MTQKSAFAPPDGAPGVGDLSFCPQRVSFNKSLFQCLRVAGEQDWRGKWHCNTKLFRRLG